MIIRVLTIFALCSVGIATIAHSVKADLPLISNVPTHVVVPPRSVIPYAPWAKLMYETNIHCPTGRLDWNLLFTVSNGVVFGPAQNNAAIWIRVFRMESNKWTQVKLTKLTLANYGYGQAWTSTFYTLPGFYHFEIYAWSDQTEQTKYKDIFYMTSGGTITGS